MTKLTHEVHTSERKSFKGCRRRWDWHFRQNWTPIGSAPPLEFGIAYHKGMEVLYNPETWGWDREVVGELAVKTFVDECNKQRNTYLRETDAVELEPAVQDDYDERIELGKGMLRYYYREQLPKNPDGFRPVKVEISFEVPILDPETGEQLMCKCDQCWRRFIDANADDPAFQSLVTDGHHTRERWVGLPVTYAGRIDALGEDDYGDYWIVDWKTARALSEDEEFLQLDDQIGSYVWALRKILGLPVRGFIYHEQKKGYPQSPKMNKVNRLGCWFSVSKNQDTDYETYLKTVKAEDPEAYKAGAYDEFLDWLKREGPSFYRRHVVFKNDHELDEIEKNIAYEALDMIDPTTRIYPNAGRFACKFCAFRQPCIGQNRGEQFQYTLQTLFKKEEPYYYRQVRGASTEGKGGE
jgi:PD-(D/E)XK nuclease superfamily protein